MLRDLNARLQKPLDARDEDLATVLADIGVVDLTAHSMPRRRYRGSGHWAWQMRREIRQVMGRGDYILRIDMESFSNAGLREACIYTDHRMVLAVLRGEGALRNCRYVGGRT